MLRLICMLVYIATSKTTKIDKLFLHFISEENNNTDQKYKNTDNDLIW